MKRLILPILLVSVMGSISLAEPYVYDGPFPVGLEFSITNHDLATWDILENEYTPSSLSATDTDPCVPGIGWDVPGINNAEFNFNGFHFGGETWASGQVGWSMYRGNSQGYWGPAIDPVTADDTLPTAYWDLSDYESFMVSFHNEVFMGVYAGAKDHAVMAALFINTGYPDQGVADHYYQSDWVWAVPCDILILDLDFNNAITGWNANGDPIYGTIDNLNQVSALGVIIGSNLYDGTNLGIGDETGFKVCIDTVPVPGAVLLGILGLGAAGWKLRKFA